MQVIKSSILFLTLLCFNFSLSAQDQPTIVFVHGLFQNEKSWEHWQEYFEKQGYKTHAPSYPFHESDPQVLKANIIDSLPLVDFWMAYHHIEKFIDKLAEKPILIGHSMGGLIMQKLMENGKISMGIAIAPANPRGISIIDWTYISNNFRMVDPFKRRDIPCTPRMDWFMKTFFNNLSPEQAKIEFETYFIPESRIIAKSSTARGTEIDFSKSHAPMLFISGGNDQDLPAKLIRKNYEAYQDLNSHRTYFEFPGRSHYICGEPGWEEVADFIENWITSSLKHLDFY